jgi:small subunit ribosomal protein S1
MKQRTSVSVDEYLAEHAPGSTVSGRILEVSPGLVRVELGEGIEGAFRSAAESPSGQEAPVAGKVDLSSLSSMLTARWKGGPGSGPVKPEAMQPGQIRSFRVRGADPDARKIELTVA